MDQLLFLLILTSFHQVANGGANAHSHEIETYWHTILPNAVIPKPLKDLIPHGLANGQKVVPNFNFTQKFLAPLVADANKFRRYYLGHPTQWNRLIDAENQTDFFLEKDLHQGMRVNLRFVSYNKATFLSRQVANSIPFISNKLPEILKQLSIKPGSKQEKLLNTTLTLCEQPHIKGKHKYCATSLESMVDFSTSRLGKNVKALATELNGKSKDQTQSYALVRVNKVGDDKSIVCHKIIYAFAVYLCHEIPATSYVVSLVGADGSRVKALAVCHFDTSVWDPDFPGFKILKVRPGTTPICHFLVKDTIVWVPT